MLTPWKRTASIVAEWRERPRRNRSNAYPGGRDVNKLRWGKFYWSDWSDDPALAACSLAAQGLWMRLLCIAAQGTPYGHVTIAGKVPTVEALAKLVRSRPRDVSRWVAELEREGVAERGQCGCLVSRRMVHDGQITAARRAAAEASWRAQHVHDSCTTRASHVHDSCITQYSNDRAKPAGKADIAQNLHMQTSHFASTDAEADAEAKTESPPVGPRTAGTGARRGEQPGGSEGAGTTPREAGTNPRALGANPRANGTNPRANGTNPRKESRNAMCDIVAEEMAQHAEANDPRGSGARVVPIARHLVRRQHEPR
jgi:hypothetical protein